MRKIIDHDYRQELLEIQQTDQSKTEFIEYQKKRLAERYAENEMPNADFDNIPVEEIFKDICKRYSV